MVKKEATARIRPATSTLTLADRWDHVLARWGYRRAEHRVEPGVYRLGEPTAESPVFVTANYTLSFDALRSALTDQDAYILVLDTNGVNVWCAAGKGTFGTEELIHRIEEAGLADIVTHRVLILPQLGAAGVAAHEVKKQSGFSVEYGPVRAADLPEYLTRHQATPDMRRATFPLPDRLVLIPVELVRVLLPMIIAGVVLYVLGGPIPSLGVVTAILAGVVLFPILLPWIPTPNFSTKGLVLGATIALPFAIATAAHSPDGPWSIEAGLALTGIMSLPAITAFLALNFTGSTPVTSRSGVRREIYTYIPVMAVLFGCGVCGAVVFSVVRWIGG